MAKYSARDKKYLDLFGKQLRVLRRERGYSQEELAEHSGLHRTYVSSAERGERNVSLTNLHKLAGALGVDTAELFSRGS